MCRPWGGLVLVLASSLFLTYFQMRRVQVDPDKTFDAVVGRVQELTLDVADPDRGKVSDYALFNESRTRVAREGAVPRRVRPPREADRFAPDFRVAHFDLTTMEPNH